MPQNESPLDALKKDPQAARLLSDPAALKALLTSPEARNLMTLLSRQSGESLQAAAKAAAGGKPEELSAMVSQLMQNREGAAAVQQLQRKAQG